MRTSTFSASPLAVERALQPAGQGLVAAEDEDGLVQNLGGARPGSPENERLAAAGHTVDDPVAVAQAAGELPCCTSMTRTRSGGGAVVRGEEIGLGRFGDADFGKEVPADAVDLGREMGTLRT